MWLLFTYLLRNKNKVIIQRSFVLLVQKLDHKILKGMNENSAMKYPKCLSNLMFMLECSFHYMQWLKAVYVWNTKCGNVFCLLILCCGNSVLLWENTVNWRKNVSWLYVKVGLKTDAMRKNNLLQWY